MKKYLFIGLTLLLVLLGISAFFYTHTKPDSNTEDAINAQFGEAGYRDPVTITADAPTDTVNTADTTTLLRQVTTRPVAGAVLFMRDNTPYARYAEQGTGYMYEVNLNARAEERVSNTTFRQVEKVVFSPQGTRATVLYTGETGKEVAYGTIEKGDDGVSKFVGSILPIGSGNTGFNKTGDVLYYTLETNSGIEGYERDIKAGTTKILFIMPLHAITVTWSPSPLIVTTPSYSLFGAAYRKSGERVAYGLGLMALMSPSGTSTLISTMSQSGPQSAIVDGTVSRKITTMAFSPKCAFATESSLICGVPQDSIETHTFPDDWLMGTLKTDDSLYLIETSGDTAREIVNPTDATGRSLDVTNMQVLGNVALFTNRLDSTLWTVSF